MLKFQIIFIIFAKFEHGWTNRKSVIIFFNNTIYRESLGKGEKKGL